MTTPHLRGWASAPAARRARPWLPDLGPRPAERGSASGLPLRETSDLLARLNRATCAEDLEAIASHVPARVAAYCAVPDTTLPFLKLRIGSADPALLAFAGKAAPGFEVLEVFRAGFQYHWRRDLVRTCDEQRPQLGRLCGQGARRELAVDHLTVPILRKGRVREVRGWLAFSEDILGPDGPLPLDDLSMFRRTEPSRALHLSPYVLRPQAEAARLQELFGRMKGRWTARGAPRRPS